MPDISSYLDDIQNAVYGEDVRSSICNAIREINEYVESSIEENYADIHELIGEPPEQNGGNS